MPQDRYDAQQASAPADQAPPEDSSAQFREEGVSPEEAGPATDGPPADGGAALVEPADEAIRRLTAEVDEVQDRYLRLAAEFDNFRKRSQRDQAELVARASERVVMSLLPVLDSLDAAMAVEPDGEASEKLLEGMRGTRDQLLGVLAQEGLTPIESIGLPFDPAMHEAIQIDEGSGTMVVTAELRRGYQFQDRVLRAALVSVGYEEADQPE